MESLYGIPEDNEESHYEERKRGMLKTAECFHVFLTYSASRLVVVFLVMLNELDRSFDSRMRLTLSTLFLFFSFVD